MPKQKNLLEAFRDAGGSGGGEGSSSAGPFAGPPAGGAKGPGAAPPPPRPAAGEKGSLPPWAPLALVGALCFVLGVAVGRATTSGTEETLAAEKGGDPALAGTEPGNAPAGIRPPAGAPPRASASGERRTAGEDARTSPPPRDPSPLRDPVEALRDPANLFTVVAVTYGGSQESNARATQRLLADLGLPVFPPVKAGSYLLILVGASPTRAGLDDVLRRVKAAEDWNGEKAFASAYVDRIDTHVHR